MIHLLLLVVSAYLVVVGILLCATLIFITVKGRNGIGLVTLPALFIVAVLGIDFVCHVMHLPRHIIPYQKQTVNAIHWILDAAMVPLVLIKLRELWLKKQTHAETGKTR